MKPFQKIQAVILAVTVCGLTVGALALAQNPEADITGFYNEKDGEFFQIVKNGASYQVLWRYKAGDWVGVAIRDGDRFAIGWQRSDRANLGVSLYTIEKGEKGPRMVGGWAAYPGGGIAPDTLNFSRRAGAQAAD